MKAGHWDEMPEMSPPNNSSRHNTTISHNPPGTCAAHAHETAFSAMAGQSVGASSPRDQSRAVQGKSERTAETQTTLPCLPSSMGASSQYFNIDLA